MARSSDTAANELKVLCGGALHQVLDQLGQAYMRARGVAVHAEFATSAAIADRAAQGEDCDIVISTDRAVEGLSAAGTIVAASAAVVARSAIGVAVRAGRPKPDISSTEAFVATLRRASSIARADPAFRTPSGVYVQNLFDRLGLTAELQPKTLLIASIGGKPVVVCEAVAKGEAELGIQQISEIVAVPGVDLVGPLPPEIQHITVFSAAITAHAVRPQLSRDFIAFLTSDAAKPVLAANGMESA